MLEDNKKVFASNLLRLISMTGINQAELADHLNIPRSTMSNWIKGNTYPRIDKIQAIANYFGVMKSDLTEDKKVEYRFDYESKELLRGEIRVPLLNVSAGGMETDYMDEEVVEAPYYMHREYKIKDLFAIRVNGESMNKVIPNRSLIICCKVNSNNELHSGDIVVFKRENEYCIKKYYETDTTIIFEPMSFLEGFETLVFIKNDMDSSPVEVLGIVKHQYNRFD